MDYRKKKRRKWQTYYMASRKSISDDFNKMIDILNNPIRKRLRVEYRRAQKEAIDDYLNNRAIDPEIYTRHEQKLYEIALRGFRRSLEAGAKFQLKLFKNDGDLTDRERIDFYSDVSFDFEQFSLTQARESAQAMAKTTKETVDWLIEKYTEADKQKEANGILDIIQGRMKCLA